MVVTLGSRLAEATDDSSRFVEGTGFHGADSYGITIVLSKSSVTKAEHDYAKSQPFVGRFAGRQLNGAYICSDFVTSILVP